MKLLLTGSGNSMRYKIGGENGTLGIFCTTENYFQCITATSRSVHTDLIKLYKV